MTGPDEPWDDPPAWDFPELAAPDPASVTLPDPGPEPIYDTGSDGWWRAQAKAQREATESEPAPLFRPMPSIDVPPVTPLELIEPSVLNDPAFLPTGPSPLEDAYLPPEEVFPPVAAEPAWEEPAPEPVAVAPAYEPPVYESPAYEAPVHEAPVYEEPAAEEPVPAEPPPPPHSPPLMRPLVVPEPSTDWYDEQPPVDDGPDRRVGLGRVLAWAGLAVAGVGLLVVAFLLLGKDEPKGTPTVSAPTVTTAPTVEPTAEPTVEPTAEPTAQPTVTKVAAAPVGPIVPLTVLNNSRISHLAERAAAKFRAGGWPVPATGNYRGKLSETTIFYPEGQKASALRFAKQFGVRALPRPSTLPGSGMTVVVTRDFA